MALEIGLARADRQQRDRLRLVEQRQRVVRRARGLARAVPGHQHAPSERGESPAYGHDQHRTSRREDEVIRRETGRQPVLGRSLRVDHQIGGARDSQQVFALAGSEELPVAARNPVELQCLAKPLLDDIGQLEPAGVIALCGRRRGGSRDAGDQTAFGDGGRLRSGR